MKSLLLSGKNEGIVTLELIKGSLYNLKKTITIGNMSFIPNGKYSNNLHKERICEALINDHYCDSVLFKADGKEYPIYFGAYSKDDIPGHIAYGKKDDQKLVLIYDEFNINFLNYLKADLEFSTFIQAELSDRYGKLFSYKHNEEIYSYFEDKRKQVNWDTIGQPNLNIIGESVEQLGKGLALLRG